MNLLGYWWSVVERLQRVFYRIGLMAQVSKTGRLIISVSRYVNFLKRSRQVQGPCQHCFGVIDV